MVSSARSLMHPQPDDDVAPRPIRLMRLTHACVKAAVVCCAAGDAGEVAGNMISDRFG